MEIKVSVIIPCYNDFLYVEQAVQSALNQTYLNKEIIVIDDGSNERTKEILNRLKTKIDLLIVQDNRGVVHARNNAIRLAKGEYILTLDSDDYFEPTFLKKAVRVLNEKENVGMVTSWVSVINERGEITRTMKPSGGNAFVALFKNTAPASLLFRKICWEEIGGYDSKMEKGYEDWEFNIAVSKTGWEIHVIPEILFNYRNRILSRNKMAGKFYSEIRRYTYKKHQDLLIQNMEETIDFLLNEVELRNKEVRRVKKSRAFKLGEMIMKPFRKLHFLFSN